MPEMPPECSLLSGLFPEYIRLSCIHVQDAGLEVFDDERHLVEKAVEKRRREFSAGRCCARQALRELGCADTAIIHDQNGAPVWPQGIVGSITHSAMHAAAAAAKASRLHGLGIDLETVSRVSTAITDKILTDPEKKRLWQLPDDTAQQRLLALFFSAKEAIYKCLHPLLQCQIGFADARIECVPGQNALHISMCARIQSDFPGVEGMQGRYCYFDDTVFSAVWLEATA